MEGAPCGAPGGAAGSEPGFAFTLLPRHGRRPLGFEGRLLAQAEAADPALPVASSVALHEMAGGGFVCAVRHVLRAPLPEARRCYAEAASGPEAVLAFLHAHDPLRDLPGDVLLGPALGGAAQDPSAAEAGQPGAAETVRLAAELAPKLRAAWRGLLEACFGAAPHDPPTPPAFPPGESA